LVFRTKGREGRGGEKKKKRIILSKGHWEESKLQNTTKKSFKEKGPTAQGEKEKVVQC